jgi:hypothetical protein
MTQYFAGLFMALGREIQGLDGPEKGVGESYDCKLCKASTGYIYNMKKCRVDDVSFRRCFGNNNFKAFILKDALECFKMLRKNYQYALNFFRKNWHFKAF